MTGFRKALKKFEKVTKVNDSHFSAKSTLMTLVTLATRARFVPERQGQLPFFPDSQYRYLTRLVHTDRTERLCIRSPTHRSDEGDGGFVCGPLRSVPIVLFSNKNLIPFLQLAGT
jgi:hypothetical protein